MVVTNPVGLGVGIFSRRLDRHRVLGMGAQQDSLRFARAIAEVAGVRRNRVHAWVLGERGRRPASGIEHHRQRMFELLAAERVREAFEAVEALPPDLPVMLEPFITAHCLHSTPNATANASLDLVRALCGSRGTAVGPQVRLEDEVFGLDGVLGVPVLADAGGWSSVVCPPLGGEERARLFEVAAAIRTNLSGWTG